MPRIKKKCSRCKKLLLTKSFGLTGKGKPYKLCKNCRSKEYDSSAAQKPTSNLKWDDFLVRGLSDV